MFTNRKIRPAAIRKVGLKPAVIRKTGLKPAAVIVVLAAAFLPAGYVRSVYGFLPGLGILFLLALSLLCLRIMRRGVRFETDALDAVCQRGDIVSAVLKVKNRSVLAYPKATAFLFVTDFFTGEDSASPILFSMSAKSATEFPFEVKLEHIGVYTFGIRAVRLYDPLGIFSAAVPGNESYSVTVLPRIYQTDEIQLKEKQLTESRNLSKSSVSDGFDYTGVREYALGDSMKRIHWKLSAHSSSYMTRITESSKKSDLTVAVDFISAACDGAILPDVYDCLTETALSLAAQALSKDLEYSLLFVGRDGEMTRAIPKGEQDYQELVLLLPDYNSVRRPDFLDGAEMLAREGHLGNKSSNIILCTARITEDLIREMVSVKQQQRDPELYYIALPRALEDEPRSLEPSLGVLDEYGIRYHLLYAEA